MNNSKILTPKPEEIWIDYYGHITGVLEESGIPKYPLLDPKFDRLYSKNGSIHSNDVKSKWNLKNKVS